MPGLLQWPVLFGWVSWVSSRHACPAPREDWTAPGRCGHPVGYQTIHLADGMLCMGAKEPQVYERWDFCRIMPDVFGYLFGGSGHQTTTAPYVSESTGVACQAHPGAVSNQNIIPVCGITVDAKSPGMPVMASEDGSAKIERTSSAAASLLGRQPASEFEIAEMRSVDLNENGEVMEATVTGDYTCQKIYKRSNMPISCPTAYTLHARQHDIGFMQDTRSMAEHREGHISPKMLMAACMRSGTNPTLGNIHNLSKMSQPSVYLLQNRDCEYSYLQHYMLNLGLTCLKSRIHAVFAPVADCGRQSLIRRICVSGQAFAKPETHAGDTKMESQTCGAFWLVCFKRHGSPVLVIMHIQKGRRRIVCGLNMVVCMTRRQT